LLFISRETLHSRSFKMKSLVVVLLAIVFLVDAKAPLLGTTNPEVIPGRYIVVFHPNTTTERTKAHLSKLASLNQNILHQYNIGGIFKGFAAELTDSALETVRSADEVAHVEADQMMHVAASCHQQTGSEWGLSRLWQRTMSLHGKFTYDSTGGAGVNAYIVDTGIRVTHSDFAGRCSWGANFVNDGKNTDCNGHGTHVAGTVGGTTYGVAKKVTLIAVKVLGCTGSGTNSGVIAGIDYSAESAIESGKPSVINMSLGGSLSTATNAAVDAANDAGIVVVVASGNSNADACGFSPASAKKVLSIGATTIADNGGQMEDARSTFSNYGSCVHLFAPGQNIKSAWIDDNSDTNSISGTSMASPHVCGLAALYMSASGQSNPETVKTHIKNSATTNEIDLLCANSACNKSPNKMAYIHCA